MNTSTNTAQAIRDLQIAVAAITAHLGIGQTPEAPVTEVPVTPAPAPKAAKAGKRKGKKARKAQPVVAAVEAVTGEVPEFIRVRAAHREANRAQAAWMRSHGLVPSGQAWEAVSKGERGVKALKALNREDGLSLPQAKPAQASTAKPAAVVAQVSTAAPAKASNRAEAAKASAQAKPRVNGQFIRADLAPKAEALRAAGLSEAEVAAALAALA
jgi:hypothetical protein